MVKNFFLLILRVYQLTLSAILGSHCRFYPTCSEYTRQAIEVHGLSRGILLSSKRLCKCHPFHPGGIDPVPTNEQIKV